MSAKAAAKQTPASSLQGSAAATWEPLATLVPWAKNPRKNDAAVPRVLQSLISYGWGRALVARARDGRVVVGHTALRAARELVAAYEKASDDDRKRWHPEAVQTARTGLVPVRLREFTDAEAAALTVADNRLGEFALWDDAPLLEILRGFDAAEQLVIGYDEEDIAKLLASVNPTITTEPPANVPTRAKLGDLWQLGEHRMLVGDNRKAADVERLFGGAKPELMITDPPWGVEYDPQWREKLAGTPVRRSQKIQNDDITSWRETWQLFPGSVAYVWHAMASTPETAMDLEAVGFERRALIIWVKTHFPIGRGHYHQRHEPCWYAVRKGDSGHWIGDRKQTTVWDDIPLDPTVEGGPASQKPIELMARSLRNHKGDVYEPFVGAGGTLLAAQSLERRCFAMDIDPRCVDAVLSRWEAATGEKAVRLSQA